MSFLRAEPRDPSSPQGPVQSKGHPKPLENFCEEASQSTQRHFPKLMPLSLSLSNENDNPDTQREGWHEVIVIKGNDKAVFLLLPLSPVASLSVIWDSWLMEGTGPRGLVHWSIVLGLGPCVSRGIPECQEHSKVSFWGGKILSHESLQP